MKINKNRSKNKKKLFLHRNDITAMLFFIDYIQKKNVLKLYLKQFQFISSNVNILDFFFNINKYSKYE